MNKKFLSRQGIKGSIYRLRKKRHFLETYLLNTGSQLPIWVTTQYTYCKKGNCKCTRGKPHGPFHYLFFKQHGKIFHRYISQKNLSRIERLISCYQTYTRRLAEINKINKQIDIFLREYQRQNLLPIPKWIKEKKRKISGHITKKITR